jgi:putative membrane protein insertion efficiency factor
MKHLCIWLIRLYRKYLSPRKGMPTCRFTPTCSTYALQAYEKRGFFIGTLLTVGRICRCQPFGRAGYDPVPEKGFRNKPTSRILGDTHENCEHTDFTENEKEN